MAKKLQNALQILKRNLNSGKASVQITLLDLANLKQGKQFARSSWKSAFEDQWQPAVENMMWRVDNIIPADEAYCDCDTYGDYNDLMDLVNHDGNFSFYVKEDYVSSNKEPKAISKQTANKIIDYVSQHLDNIKNFVENDKASFEVLQRM